MNSIQDNEITTKTLRSGQAISDVKAVIAVYNTHPEAEGAVKELQRAGFDVKKLSVVGKATTRTNRWWATTTQVIG